LAPTGPSANNISGRTYHSALGYSKKSNGSKMSSQQSAMVGANCDGTKLTIIDEISLVSQESLAHISNRLIQAQCTHTTDSFEIERIKQTPFGGMNMIFLGDFWQLRPVGGTPLFINKPDSSNYAAVEGRKLWLQINEFEELTENCRFVKADVPIFQNFLSKARIGILDPSLLLQMNTRCVTEVTAKRIASPNALWIANTREEVNKLNVDDFSSAQSKAIHYRIACRHKNANLSVKYPTKDVQRELFKQYDKNCALYRDFYVGQRVAVTANLATQIGILIHTIFALIQQR